MVWKIHEVRTTKLLGWVIKVKDTPLASMDVKGNFDLFFPIDDEDEEDARKMLKKRLNLYQRKKSKSRGGRK